MKPIVALTKAVLLLIVSAAFNGCGVSDSMDKMNKNTERMATQIEQDQQYIKSLTETSTKHMELMTSHMDRMATQIEQDQQYIKQLSASLDSLAKVGTTMFTLISDSLFVKEPPTKSDDIDDVLNGPKTPQPPHRDRETSP